MYYYIIIRIQIGNKFHCPVCCRSPVWVNMCHLRLPASLTPLAHARQA